MKNDDLKKIGIRKPGSVRLTGHISPLYISLCPVTGPVLA
jgi:hypothetical protein